VVESHGANLFDAQSGCNLPVPSCRSTNGYLTRTSRDEVCTSRRCKTQHSRCTHGPATPKYSILKCLDDHCRGSVIARLRAPLSHQQNFLIVEDLYIITLCLCPIHSYRCVSVEMRVCGIVRVVPTINVSCSRTRCCCNLGPWYILGITDSDFDEG
jgi:hypothetical protein